MRRQSCTKVYCEKKCPVEVIIKQCPYATQTLMTSMALTDIIVIQANQQLPISIIYSYVYN